MTKVLRLEAKGFKSFANQTTVEFGDEFNCILGPNGSGKSNVLDAICFVLGKSSAKGLRAEKSANLIYNGGKSKKAAKEGSVSITFDNEDGAFGDFKELTITRIVKQNGSSTYKINDETRTRQEVLDMLSKAKIDPDGYNIILQGDIVRLVEMSPAERRGIIEEIAGINIYEEKKTKAMRELDRVEQQLNEADIVLKERETYLKELKKERDQAAKFKELDEKIKRNKKTLLDNKLNKKHKELKELEDKINKNEEEKEKLSEKIKALEEDRDEKKGEVEEINKEVEARGEREQVALHKEVEQLKVDLAVKKQRIEDLNREIKKVEERKEELKKTNKELFDKIKLIEDDRDESKEAIKSREKNIEDLEKSIKEYKEKHKMEDAAALDEKIAKIDEEAEGIQEAMAGLREEQQALLREKDRLEVKLEQADEQIEKVLELEKANKEQVKELKEKKAQFKKTTKELSDALAQDTSLGSQLSTAREKLVSRKEELGKLEARHNTIKEGAAGGLAVQKILEQKKKGVHGTVAELGSVNEEYAQALETAAGGRMMSVVVEDDKVASECINYLRNARHGVATFLPLNKIRGAGANITVPKKKGVIGKAVDLVDYDKKFAKVFEYVFGSTIVVDSIETARSVGVGTVRMVTLKGDLVETSGAMSGGYRNRKRSVGFQQKEAAKEMKELEKTVSDLEGVVARLDQERRDNEELITRLRQVKGDLEGDIIKLEKTLHIDSGDMDMNKDLKKKLEAELKEKEKEADDAMKKISEKNKRLATLKTEKMSLREQMSEMRSPAVLAQLNTYEEKKETLRKEIGDYKAKLQSNESEIKNILGPESEKVKNILKQHDKEVESFTKEHSTLKGTIKEIERELKEKEAAEKEFYEQFKGLFNKRSKLSDEISSCENKIREHQDKQSGLDQKNNNLGLEGARIKAEVSGLEEENQHYEGVEAYKSKSVEDIRTEIKEFERMREDFGAVNMKALEIYETVEHEYHELVKKKEKLSSEREDVLVMINEIDDKKRELFLNTYDVVSKNFESIFELLSTKGKAHLALEDRKDPFNGGLTIKVKLTSKKFMDIRSLSGGEKTMTALAFLFAVQEYEPASFYILDEVDAALDKHNSEKLAKLIRAYCKNAQYIIISHNDGVISEADNLYGVSMNEHGMSKVTSLKV